MQGVQVVHCCEGAAVRVCHDAEHVEVVTHFVSRQQQVSTGVKLKCANRFRCVRREVRNELVAAGVLVDADARGGRRLPSASTRREGATHALEVDDRHDPGFGRRGAGIG